MFKSILQHSLSKELKIAHPPESPFKSYTQINYQFGLSVLNTKEIKNNRVIPVGFCVNTFPNDLSFL